MEKSFPPDSYHAGCSVCGRAQYFARQAYAIRETYRCIDCHASLREREQASAILDCYAPTGTTSLAELVKLPSFASLQIYEPGTSGALRSVLQQLPFYRQSDYFVPEEREKQTPQVPHQDLQALDYPDQSFDLVLTSDILEHVRHPHRALWEIARVLKPGGRHIFTVPLQDPMPPESISRVDVSDAVDRHLLPPHYHGDGKGGRSLVYTDFGADIADLAYSAGLATRYRRGMTTSATANAAITLISTRMPVSVRAAQHPLQSLPD